jgi:hypothetical protein
MKIVINRAIKKLVKISTAVMKLFKPNSIRQPEIFTKKQFFCASNHPLLSEKAVFDFALPLFIS